MPVTVLVGCQFGDEGKGKIVDHLARRMDWVARFQGGANAGHTVVIGRKTYILHLVPSGILHPRPQCVIGHGVVVDPAYLVEEIDSLAGQGIPLKDRLFISEGAHAILPYHRWLEALDGQDVRVGTTKRGIGPSYQDKMGRTGIRLYEMAQPRRLRKRLEEHIERLRKRFRGAGLDPPQPLESALSEWVSSLGGLAHRLRPHLADTVSILHDAQAAGERILAEGAQGTFLDIDLGTYPYVTSSTTTASGACTGLGLPPSAIKKVIGVCKAYATRVGEGPFVTELSDADAEAMRTKGAEFGATTGRPRRIGWLDLVQLRQAVRVNGTTSLVLTKMDVLTGESKIKLCVAYETPDGERSFPPVHDVEALSLCKPVYEEADGWSEPIGSIRRFRDLPDAARAYIRRVEKAAGCRIQTVSVGSSRSAAIPVPPESA